MIDVLKSKLLTSNNVKHGFSKRNGDLNTKVSPRTTGSIEQVSKNLEQLITEHSIVKPLIYLYLDGGAEVIDVTNQLDGNMTALNCDGAVTNQDLTLGITVADCLPILLVDTQAGVSGISHAGWKGSAGKITSKVVQRMVDFGAQPQNIVASIGPSICSKCYEIGPEVAEQFDDLYLVDGPNKDHLDMWLANEDELKAAGVTQIENAQICTFEHQDDYFSARGENPTGRFLAYITNTSVNA